MSFCCLAAKSVTRFFAAIALARCGRAEAAMTMDDLLPVAESINSQPCNPNGLI